LLTSRSDLLHEHNGGQGGLGRSHGFREEWLHSNLNGGQRDEEIRSRVHVWGTMEIRGTSPKAYRIFSAHVHFLHDAPSSSRAAQPPSARIQLAAKSCRNWHGACDSHWHGRSRGMDTAAGRCVRRRCASRQRFAAASLCPAHAIPELYKDIPSQIGRLHIRSSARLTPAAAQVKFGTAEGEFDVTKWLTPHVG
jgi:hypothetical protein